MVVDENIITLSREEAKDLIEKECKKRLGMSAAEFLLKFRRGELPDYQSVQPPIELVN